MCGYPGCGQQHNTKDQLRIDVLVADGMMTPTSVLPLDGEEGC